MEERGRAAWLPRVPRAVRRLHRRRSRRERRAVVHAGIGTSWRESERVAVNVQGTKDLVEASLKAGVKRFVHVSTIALYGDQAAGVITEDTAIRPRKGWDYAESKYAAEQIVLE